MYRDITLFLWLLKLGSLVNLYFLVKAQALASSGDAAEIVLPAQIFFAVSAYRCLFPVRYENNVVFHDSVASSIFVTRVLATFSEVAYISLLSYVLRLLNIDHVKWVTALSWLIVALVVISQSFVWAAILTPPAPTILLRGTRLGTNLRREHGCQRISLHGRRGHQRQRYPVKAEPAIRHCLPTLAGFPP